MHFLKAKGLAGKVSFDRDTLIVSNKELTVPSVNAEAHRYAIIPQQYPVENRP